MILKFIGENFQLQNFLPGNDYLNPEIDLIVDDMIENEEKKNYYYFLQNWIKKKINLNLKSLMDLKI